MTTNYRAAIDNGGALYWLPLPITEFSATPARRIVTTPIPGVDGVTVLSISRDALSIRISGLILGYAVTAGYYDPKTARTRDNAHAIKRALEGYIDSGGIKHNSPLDGQFDLYRWDDAYYPNCYCERMEIGEWRHTSRMMPYSLDIVCPGGWKTLPAAALSDESEWKLLVGSR